MIFLKKNSLKILSIVVGGLLLLSSPSYAVVDLDRDLFLRQIETLRDEEPPPPPPELAEVALEEAGLKRLWPKGLKLSCQAGETFNDNVFRTRKTRKREWITKLAPAFHATLQNPKRLFLLSGSADINIYGKNKHQSYWDPRLTARAELFRTSKIKLFVRDILLHQTTIGESASEKPTKNMGNNFGIGFQYEISPKTSFKVDYDQTVSYYFSEINRGGNSLQNTISPSFQWHFTPKITIAPKYAFTLYDYYQAHNGANYKSHTGSLVLRGDLTSKSRIDFSGGYEYLIYHSQDFKNLGAPVFSGGYDYQWTKKTSFRIFGSRRIDDNLNKATGNEPATSDGTASTSANYTINTAFGFVIRHNLNKKITTRLSAYYGRQKPVSTDPDSNPASTKYIDLNAGMSYHLTRFLSLLFSYTYSMALSKEKGSEYKQNKAFCGLKGTFG